MERERNLLVAGGLLIGAAVALGAVSGEWTPGAAEAPVLPVMHAQPPAATTADPAPPRPGRTPSDPTSLLPTAPASTPSAAPRATTPATPVVQKDPVPIDAAPEEALLVLEGSASWVSDALAGNRTASGAPYDPNALIAAHRALPFGTRLRVTNLANERSVEVTVVDRGPFVGGRILDLSRSAAERIDLVRVGHARVRVEVLEYGG